MLIATFMFYLNCQLYVILLMEFCSNYYVSSSIKRPTAEKSHNSWENSDDSRNKLLKPVSTSKIISKVIKNIDK